MTISRQTLILAALSAAYLVPLGQGAKPGSSSSPPSKLAVIADFKGPNVTTDADGPYSDLNLSGGWSNMPGTGNFTLQLQGSGSARRYLLMGFTQQILSPDPPPQTPFPYQGDAEISLFLSMNRLCSADAAWDPDNQDAHCDATSDGSVGSLKNMKYQPDGRGDILVNFRAGFPEEGLSKSELRVHCGQVPDGVDNPNPYVETDDPIRAHCASGRAGDNACLEWELTPYTDPGTLSCSVFRRISDKGSYRYEGLGVYNIPFRLILQRDENGDGQADCLYTASGCALE